VHAETELATDIGRYRGASLGGSHRAGWQWPFHHYYKQHPALIPTSHPTNAPPINAIANGGWFEQAQKPGLNLHGNPCMARLGGTVKSTNATI
jgi:hypothetical protein